MIKQYKAFLRWWLLAILLVVSTFFCFEIGVLDHVWENDITKISFIILAIFVVCSSACGYQTWYLNFFNDKNVIKEIKNKSKIGWFISGLFLDLGMVGTLLGFSFIFGTTFGSIDFSNVATAKAALGGVSKGMSTALYTTLIGLICSALIKIQYFNLDLNLKELADEK